MSIILTTLAVIGIVIAAIIGLLLVLFAIALLCKFTYKVKIVKASKDAQWEYDIRIRWLFGLIKRAAKSSDIAVEAALSRPLPEQPKPAAKPEKSNKRKKPEKSKKLEKPEKPNRLDTLKTLDFNTAFRITGYTFSLAKKIFTTFVPKRAVVRGRYGTENPATTGKVLAAVYAASAALSIETHIEGDFENEALELDIRMLGYFRLWAVFWPVVRYIIRPEIWRLIFPKKVKKTKETKMKNKMEVDENGNGI
ncbi:MAG: hypothetical protein FWE34_05730 [Defluviitaleaceae bacterium]|nr:hypothetical protein [Defluviitaleaceae bacterium]